MKIAPILLRVSGIVASADLNGATVSNIAIFFDRSFYLLFLIKYLKKNIYIALNFNAS